MTSTFGRAAGWVARGLMLWAGIAALGCGMRPAAPEAVLPGPAHGSPTSAAVPEAQPRPSLFARHFTTGATGPGIDYSDCDPLLNGALNPQTGWPGVFLDHFAPRPERVRDLWIVQTRDCPQVLGSDPWPCLKALRFDGQGRLSAADPQRLIAEAAGRPVVVLIQGNLSTADMALGGLLWAHTWLDRHHALPPDALLVAFDWPAQRVYSSGVRDVNEKGARAFVAGHHLAHFLLAFPAGSRVCLVGHSFGSRVAASALHLLGGGTLAAEPHEALVHLPGCRTDLRLRAVLLGAGIDHHWLVPGERLGNALGSCEALLNLYNSQDKVLAFYPLLLRSQHGRALGRVGMLPWNVERLGPVGARYTQADLADLIGREHTLILTLAHPQAARWIAPYTWGMDADLPAIPSAPPPPVPDGPSVNPRNP